MSKDSYLIVKKILYLNRSNWTSCVWHGVIYIKIILSPRFLLIQYDNKQLLDEVEHDIMNYQNRGLCYLPKPR